MKTLILLLAVLPVFGQNVGVTNNRQEAVIKINQAVDQKSRIAILESWGEIKTADELHRPTIAGMSADLLHPFREKLKQQPKTSLHAIAGAGFKGLSFTYRFRNLRSPAVEAVKIKPNKGP